MFLDMTNHEKIIEFACRIVSLTEEEKVHFASSFKEAKVKKRQLIVQPGATAQHRNYIVQGMFRAYAVDHKGQDHTVSFAIEDWWITDYNSYVYQQPATLHVVALEDSIVLQLDFATEQALKASNHKFEKLFRILAERGLAFYQRRVISNLTQSAEERYLHFLTHYPKVALRLPQFVLASYLGMTTEFLSRIRNKRSKSKA